MLSSLFAALLFAQVDSIKFESALAIGPFPSGGRTPCPTDPIAYRINAGTWKGPKVAEEEKLGAITRSWKKVISDKDGWFSDDALRGGYVYVSYISDSNKTMTLDASGHSMVYVNGVPRGGDPYGFGYVQLPVPIKKGANEFLFSVGRGRVRASLKAALPGVSITNLDPTLPDIIVGKNDPLWGSVLISNSTNNEVRGKIRCSIEKNSAAWNDFTISPMTVKKVKVLIPAVNATEAKKFRAEFELEGCSNPKLNLDIESKLPTQLHRRTFVSKVDGSVQYYAVMPASNPGAKALVLSLHGASVEAISQAASYGQKPWCNIVCPTNGRPYGWDWEEWGRINAMETLEDAKRVFNPEPDRVYLTGHSMGGHGTWSVGFNHSDQFAAIAPCAGWISFWSYGGAADWQNPDPLEILMRRSANSSDTLKIIDNARNFGIYVQHGDADDNVPVEQAREMRKRLAEFHRDVDWHEEPGQSHWFDTDPEAGANVQDTAPLFDFLAKHRIPSALERRQMSITVANPDGATRVANAEIKVQLSSMEPSKLTVRTYADASFEEIWTENVAVLQLTPLLGKGEFKYKIDGQEMTANFGDQKSLFLERSGGSWKEVTFSNNWKLLQDEGGVKTCFGNGVTAIYATGGDKSMRDWAYNKARFDAETWWYRGNSALNLMSDVEVKRQQSDLKNVVIYGNPATNSYLKEIAPKVRNLPFASNGLDISVGDKKLKEDCGLLWGGVSQTGYRIGIIGGNSSLGCRTTERVPVFLSGVHFPDFYAVTNEMYLRASKGVAAAGFYDPNWEFKPDRFAFRD